MVFKKTVSSHTDVVGEAAEILQSVHVVVVLDDILYSSVAVLSCAISTPLCSKTVLSKKLSKMWPGDGCVNHKSTDQEV